MTESDKDLSSISIIRSWAERNGFSDWVIAVLWLILAFLLFQIVAGLVFVGLMFFAGEITSIGELESAMMRRLDLLFIGNTTGQILFLGGATFLIARLHLAGEKVTSFLRITWRGDTITYIALASVITLVIQPVVIYLGFLNSLIPFPDALTEMQVSQYQMFEEFLKQDGIILFGLFHIALIPSFCEEVLFRGYILSAFEKSWGIITAIVVSGIIFGLFHLQLPNLLPLATLGAVFALVTWLSGSIWPAIIAHFINNGSAVVLATHYPELAFRDMSIETLPPIWMLILSILLTALIVRYMITESKVPS
jgi:uncharacterized protein